MMDKARRASVPHINLELPMQPFSDYSIHTKVMQFGWKNSGKFAVCFSILTLLSVLLPYTATLAKGNSLPLLPLINPAGGNSILSGLSSFGMFLAAITGYIMITVRFVQVSTQNENQHWQINLLNTFGLVVGYVSFFGLIIVASFPLMTTDASQDLWNPAVFLVHSVGAFFSFFFGAIYVLFQTTISLLFYERNKYLALQRLTLLLACALCFITSVLSTVQDSNVSQIGGLKFQSGKIAKGQNHLANLFEWFLVFFYSMFFLTFIQEGQSISGVITFRHSITERRISIASLTN